MDIGSKLKPAAASSYALGTRLLGQKEYDFTDHLGNVTVQFSDKKGGLQLNANGNNNLKARILSYQQYYPFGWSQPGRNRQAQKSRYGFNGMEKNDEIADGNYDFGARFYGAREGRWFSPDPLARNYIPISPYVFSLNNPISLIDPDGRVITDPQGREIIVTIDENTRTATYKYKNGKSVKKGFYKYSAPVIEKMLLTDDGVKALKDMIKMPTKIELVYDNWTSANDTRGEYANTLPDGRKVTGQDGKEYYKFATVTLYEKRIAEKEHEYKKADGTIVKVPNRFAADGADLDEGLNAAAVHEKWHLDPDQITIDEGSKKIPLLEKEKKTINAEYNAREQYRHSKGNTSEQWKEFYEDSKSATGLPKPSYYGLKKDGSIRNVPKARNQNDQSKDAD